MKIKYTLPSHHFRTKFGHEYFKKILFSILTRGLVILIKSNVKTKQIVLTSFSEPPQHSWGPWHSVYETQRVEHLLNEISDVTKGAIH